ncbi:MAG: methionine--tRNA ligase [Chloroflexi bacterium]|nr:methionine--tRNA ligase [Chloroflexota bacterium]
MAETILVCTAWPYVNGSLHVGHLAGVYVPADTFARFQRLRGNDVLMVSGSDEHGTPITVRAEQEGVSPKEIADRYHEEFLGYWRDLGISYDLYTRTGTDTHRRVVQDEFLLLQERGYLFEQTTEAFYDEKAGRFLPDRYVEGVCPNCGYAKARGDQCDNCGKLLDPIDLIEPKSRLTGETPVLRPTRHFYFDLPKLNEPLLAWARGHTNWRPNVYRFTVNFLEGGLQPRAVTRDLQWGVPVPIEGYEDKRIYVWIEAVTGYLSASVEWAERKGASEAWRRWWKDDTTRQYYFIGKDNIPFHTVIWPAILMARGDTILPYDVPSNEYMNFGGAKASKSAGIGTTVPDLLKAFDPDPIRFYLTMNAPETSDSDFSADELIRRNNDELVAAWGNLVHRSLTFTQRYFDGRVPGDGSTDPLVEAEIAKTFERVSEQLEAARFKETIREVLELARFGNRYFDEHAPWKQVKIDKQQAGQTIGTLLNLIDALKVLFAPFLPFSSARLHALLGYQDRLEDHGWCWEPLPVGQALPKPTPLFVKIETGQPTPA